jgi:hypothetical protein
VDVMELPRPRARRAAGGRAPRADRALSTVRGAGRGFRRHAVLEHPVSPRPARAGDGARPLRRDCRRPRAAPAAAKDTCGGRGEARERSPAPSPARARRRGGSAPAKKRSTSPASAACRRSKAASEPA